jgi:CRISPR-associated endonuclease/helicase Cas3
VRTFGEFFRRATGSEPYGFQARIARDGLPDLLEAPTGAGATGVILAWLWRRLYGPDPGRAARRLIYALPQRSLTEQVSAEVREWLASLGLTDVVSLHVAMGARWETEGEWRDDPHKPAIVIGTADALVSKALNRALGMSRAIFPIDFALVTNGAHWVIDEPELAPQATTTMRRLAAFAAELGTAEPFGLTRLSTSVKKPLQILDIERTGALGTRLGALRTVRRLPVEPGDHQAIATAVLKRHRPGTLTLVVVNTVDAAQRLYSRLRVDAADCTLLHARLRGIERDGRLAAVTGQPGDRGRIVVTTQVVEAGLELDAALLVTETAPWPSLIQRAGRCNRGGLLNADAEVWWLPPPDPFPYQQEDIDATARELDRLEGERLTIEALAARDVPRRRGRRTMIRQSDLARLFDTAPDPSGDDVDIAPYLRDAEELDAEDLDVEVAWATWTPGADAAPNPEIRVPAVEFRCRVPIGDVVALSRDRAVWRFDRAAGGWARVTQQPASRPRPGEVLLISAADGGYDPETGFDPAAPGPVPGVPELLTPEEWAERAALAAAETAMAADVAADAEDDPDEPDLDESEPRRWQSLDAHSAQVRDQAAALLAVLDPTIPPEAARSAVIAGYLHDLGKAHEIWQDAICALADEADEQERARIEAGRPWAKSGGTGALLFADGVAFRHELASLLLIDGPLAALAAESPDPDLTKFLVLAHHGKLRVHVRDHQAPAAPSVPLVEPVPAADALPPDGQPSASEIRGLRQGATSAVPPMLGQPATTLTVDLDQFLPDGDSPWTRTVHGLLDRYGPFILAYLEALVRISDWRASGNRDLPTV